MIPATQALDRLREGNRRFANREQADGEVSRPQVRNRLIKDQAPFAIILGCSDSRVPAEHVFDQGVGDLFVIRVAGNIVAPSQTGSIELAAELFGSRLVVVLGHSNCGAVSTTIDLLEQRTSIDSPNLRTIIERIEPAVRPLIEGEPAMPKDELISRAVRANVHLSANTLRQESPVLRRLIEEQQLVIVEAEYSLQTGVVEFFDSP